MTVRRRTWSIVLALGLLPSGGVFGSDSGTVAQSPSYRLQPGVIDAAGGHASSTSYRADGSAAQLATVGASSAMHFVLQSGFWGFLGSAPVPLVLAADKTPSQPGSVDLSWSGNSPPYTLYRAADCATVLSSVLAQTSNNNYTDGSTPTSGLACYSVLTAQPAPAPPPGSPP